jgi:hypothetical protein
MLKIKVVKTGSTTVKKPTPAACPWVIDCPPETSRG